MVTVYGAGQLRLDFGTENAAWIEMDSPDMPADVFAVLTMSVSETNQPYQFADDGDGRADKVLQPVRHGCCTYRLEVSGNWEIYEGVRFGFLMAPRAASTGKPWHITGFRAVAQILPVPYTGSFNVPDDSLLTKVSFFFYRGDAEEITAKTKTKRKKPGAKLFTLDF